MDMMAKALPEKLTAEVTEKAKRRRFAAAEKLRILKEAGACEKAGEIAALLRREGLYSSHLVSWRRARAQGETKGLQAKRRGPVPKVADERDQKLAGQVAALLGCSTALVYHLCEQGKLPHSRDIRNAIRFDCRTLGKTLRLESGARPGP